MLFLNVNCVDSKEENGESGFRAELSEENLQMGVFFTPLYLLSLVSLPAELFVSQSSISTIDVIEL